MELKNKLYKNIGIHVLSTLFTVDKGVVKVLLVKRTNNPYNGYWALPSGALYNNELLEVGAKRELKEKTGIDNVNLEMVGVFDKLDRSNLARMIGISFLGVIDINKVNIQKTTLKTSNAEYFPIDSIPILAYDHNEVIDKSLEILKNKIVKSNILKELFSKEFTLPELQKVYEALLNKNIDRRNFRKKMLSLNIIEDTNKTKIFEGKRPAKLYKFKNNITDKNVF